MCVIRGLEEIGQSVCVCYKGIRERDRAECNVQPLWQRESQVRLCVLYLRCANIIAERGI